MAEAMVYLVGLGTFLACIAMMIWLIIKADLHGKIESWLHNHKTTISKISAVIFVSAICAAFCFAYLALCDPSRMARYLHDILIPLWTNLRNY